MSTQHNITIAYAKVDALTTTTFISCLYNIAGLQSSLVEMIVSESGQAEAPQLVSFSSLDNLCYAIDDTKMHQCEHIKPDTESSFS